MQSARKGCKEWPMRPFLFAFAAFIICMPGPSLPAHATDAPQEPTLHYELIYSLEVAGRLKSIISSRFYCFQWLHLRLRSSPVKGGLRHVVEDTIATRDRPIYGIGEGPFNIQRYILMDDVDDEERRTELSRTVDAIDGNQREESACGGEPKKKGKGVHYNFYRPTQLDGGFSFTQSTTGSISDVVNGIDLEVIDEPGGRKARPLFFSILASSLGTVPCLDGLLRDGEWTEDDWEASPRELIEGPTSVSRDVYDRKMKIKDDLDDLSSRFRYTCRRDRVDRVRISGRLVGIDKVKISISGFKGKLWIEGYTRVSLVEASTGRIVSDHLNVSYGIERDKKILRIKDTRGEIDILLRKVDEPTPSGTGSPTHADL